MRIVKRALCLVLAASCAFFTGCNSIVYSGNLSLETFAPETVPPVEDEVEDAVDRTVEDQDEEKYQIEGEDAFYILPDHENDPDKIRDFKVLGCTSDGSLVYAYLTSCYGGNTGDGSQNALVLMSYQPDTRAYKVFYSSTSAADADDTRTNYDENNDVAELTASVENSSVMANRLARPGDDGGDKYFIFDNQTAYVFDEAGNELWHNNYASIIAEEVSRLENEAKKKAKGTVASVSSTISDVVMDGEYYVYIPITVELEFEETEITGATAGGNIYTNGQDILDISEEDLENTMFTTVIACYEMSIGGEDSAVVFTSQNTVWEKQKEYWSVVQQDSGIGMDSDGNFDDEAAMEEYRKKYTMDNIKSGTVGSVPDSFSAFETSGALDLKLCGIPDIFSFSLEEQSPGGSLLQKWANLTLNDLIWTAYHDSQETADQVRLAFMGMGYSMDLFWQVEAVSKREELAGAAKGVMAQAAQGDADSISDLGKRKNKTRKADDSRLVIPDLCPGKWTSGKDGSAGSNALPYTQSSKKDLEAVFAYKGSVYQENGGAEVVYRYADVEFPRRYEGAAYQPKLAMKVEKSSEAGEVSRTLSYWVEEETTDEEGNTTTERWLESETETLGSYPVSYRLILPETDGDGQETVSTKLKWVESMDTSELVAASGGYGAIYYQDAESEDGDTVAYTTTIRYNDGDKLALYDTTAAGRPMDAGTLVYRDKSAETEMIVLITDEGMCFYKKDNQTGMYNCTGRVFMPLSNLEQAAEGYGTVKYNEETATGTSEDPALQVTDEQEEIIRKNSEDGVAADTYSVSNLILLNQSDLLVSSLSGGLILVNTDNGLTFSLKDGTYYAVFSYEDSGAEKFRVVGYDTEAFTYEPGDVARAKCYDTNVREISEGKQSEALQSHLDGLANDYLSRTHRLTWTGETYEITEATAEETTANARAERLFYGSDAERETELAAVAKELGISSVPTAAKEYLSSLNRKLTVQREALGEFYRLAGLDTQEFPARTAWLLEYEGGLINAMNVKTLEDILVEVELSDEVIDRMPDSTESEIQKKETYEEYQQKLKAVQQKNSDVSGGTFETGSSQQEAAQYEALKQQYETGSQQRRPVIENTDFYQSVLNDVSSAYLEQAGEDADWDVYLRDLLGRISPDNFVDSAEEGLNELYELTGLKDESLMRTDSEPALSEELADFRRVRELEELIVRYKLRTAAYQGSRLREDFETYQDAVFGSEAEKTAAFEAGSFYQVITDLIGSSENEDRLDGSTEEEKAESWKKKMEEILGKCSGGIILEDGGQELSTSANTD